MRSAALFLPKKEICTWQAQFRPREDAYYTPSRAVADLQLRCARARIHTYVVHFVWKTSHNIRLSTLMVYCHESHGQSHSITAKLLFLIFQILLE